MGFARGGKKQKAPCGSAPERRGLCPQEGWFEKA